MKKVSIKDIAKMAGVVPSTVSLVLNGRAKEMRISTALAQKIQNIAKQAGYTPNQVAVSLRTGSSKLIGLMVEDISNIFYATLARLMEEEFRANGYRIVYCSTKNDPVNGSDLINMLYQRQVDGYIITPVEGMEKDLQSLKDQHKPVVLIDRFFPDVNVSHVLVDDKKGIADGMNHLLNKGYKNIGFITVDLGQVQMNYREQHYNIFINEHPDKLQSHHILKLSYKLSMVEMVEKISAFIKNTKDLDALFFATNYLCLAGLQSLQQLNLSMPNDIAVICFDDHDIFQLYPPGITAIRQPIENIAQSAVELLMHQIEFPKNDLEAEQVVIPASIVERGST